MFGEISRRSALKLLVPAAGAAIVVACGGPVASPSATIASPAAAGPAPTAGQASAVPRTGGTLRIGLPSEPANVDGHIRTIGSDLTYWLAFDRLIDYDEHASPSRRLPKAGTLRPTTRP